MQCRDIVFISSAKKYSWQETYYAVLGCIEEYSILQAQSERQQGSIIAVCFGLFAYMSEGGSEFLICNGSRQPTMGKVTGIYPIWYNSSTKKWQE